MMNYYCAGLVLVLATVPNLLCQEILTAEDLLQEKGQEYVGWAQPNGLFKVCKGEVRPISPGKVIKTNQKCKQPDPPILTIITGNIISVNPQASNTSDVTIIKHSDRTKAVFTYLTEDITKDSSGAKLTKLSVGQQVEIKYSTPERAESITIK